MVGLVWIDWLGWLFGIRRLADVGVDLLVSVVVVDLVLVWLFLGLFFVGLLRLVGVVDVFALVGFGCVCSDCCLCCWGCVCCVCCVGCVGCVCAVALDALVVFVALAWFRSSVWLVLVGLGCLIGFGWRLLLVCFVCLRWLVWLV